MPRPLPRFEEPQPWSWDAQAEIDLLRSLGQTDLYFFFQWVWGDRNGPKGQGWIDDAVHEPFCRWLQGHLEEWMEWRKRGEKKSKHLAIIVHRGVGKTRIVTMCAQAWLHLRDPELASYTSSEKLEMAVDIVDAIKAVLDGSDAQSLWTTLYGNWATSARMWKGGRVVHAGRRNTARRDASLGTFAVETSIVGSHPDVIFRDDPTSYDRLKTDANWFEAVNDQTTSLVPVLEADGLFCDTGTRYGSTDHFGTQLADPAESDESLGIASLSGMATDAYRVHESGLWHVYFMAGRDQDGKPTTPKVWPEHKLTNYKRGNPIRYAAQVMNDPSESDLNPITREQLKQCIVPASSVRLQALDICILTDLALWDGRKRINKDETVLIVGGIPRDGSGDVYYIEGQGDMYWRDEHVVNRILTLVQKYRRLGCRVRGISNDRPRVGLAGIWHSNLKNKFNEVNEPMPPHYELERGAAVKIHRIAACVHYWTDAHVRVLENAPGYERLFEQMLRVGEMQLIADKGGKQRRKDDWIDAFTDIFADCFYRAMRKPRRVGAMIPGARSLDIDGLDSGMFGDEEREWLNANPRPPLK